MIANPHLGPVLGGIQKDILSLTREFIAQGDRVTFVTTHDEFPEGRVDLSQPFTYELPPGLRIVRLGGHIRSRLRNFHPANPPLWLPGLARAVLEFRPDAVIFCNIGWPLTILPALLALRRHTTVLYRTAYHAPLAHRPLDAWRSRLQLKVAGLSHHLIPFSYHEKQQIIHDGGIPEDKITVVYPGVDIWSLSAEQVRAFRAGHGLLDRFVISHVSRLGTFKGTDKLLRVLPEVRQRTKHDVVLLLVGRSTEKESLDKLIRELDVGPYVRFTGPVPEQELHLSYAVSDVFALPSQYESFGFVFLEAMAYGVPAIGVRTGGVCEAIREGETGFILESSQDLDGLANALCQLVVDTALRQRMGEQARRWVSSQFSWNQSANQIKRLITQIEGQRI